MQVASKKNLLKAIELLHFNKTIEQLKAYQIKLNEKTYKLGHNKSLVSLVNIQLNFIAIGHELKCLFLRYAI